jgi:3-demethoxyubiquinol 3-hydroxylase
MNFIDRLLCEVDTGLRTVFARAHAERALPVCVGDAAPELASDPAEKSESIRLMRVNHTGEVCAQALYQGQALFARTDETRALLLHAAREERDHLAWCETRIDELGGQVSRLNPLFYAGSFAMGVASAALGDKWSLGFLVETERQVESHLTEHLGRLSSDDQRSRAIVEKMREDEIHHGQSGKEHGAASLPPPIRAGMQAVSKLMTRTAYWV